MNRTLAGMLTTAFAFCIILSCSDRSTTDPTGLALNDSTGDASRIVSATVTLAQSSLEVGKTTQATALLLDSRNRVINQVVVWSSSSTSVASVSDSGLVTALSPGTVDIIATRASKSGSATLTVTPSTVVASPVASVTVALPTSSLSVGQTTQAVDTTRDSSNNVLTGRVVTWSSGNANIASVNSTSGMVSAVGAGSTTIAATSEGATGAAPLSVTTTTPIAVASVSVAPATASLQVGGTVQLSATTRDANNNVLTGRVVTWSSSNTGISTVSASGLVTAVAAGSTTITATSETKTGTSGITVSAPAPVPVASVSVSPTTASLQVGGTAQFSAVTRDANNNILTGRVITWSSSNSAVATVSASGLGTALAAGTAQIKATSEGQIGSATLTATSPAPPPTGGGPVWRGNEPAGMTSLTDRPFDSLNEPGWGVPVAPGATIVADATAPHSPSNTIHFNYPAGFVGGSGPESTSYTVANYRVLYLAYYFKYSDNWQGHLTGINKHGYVWYGNTPVFVYEVYGVGSGPLNSRMALQVPIVQPNSDGWYTQNLVPSAQFTRGQWALMEIVLTGNTSGTADGALDWYMNGVHVAHYTGIQYTSGTTAFNWVRIAPIWGGITDTVLADQYLSFDHYYISGKN